MSTTRTPTYRVHLRVYGSHWTPMAWHRSYGRPTDDNLAAFVRSTIDSCRPGGVNAHLGVPNVLSAKIVRQSTGTEVATYTAPMFSVI